MNVWDYVLIAIIVIAAAGAAAAVIIRKKRRGSACPGCSDCAYSGSCPMKGGNVSAGQTRKKNCPGREDEAKNA